MGDCNCSSSLTCLRGGVIVWLESALDFAKKITLLVTFLFTLSATHCLRPSKKTGSSYSLSRLSITFYSLTLFSLFQAFLNSGCIFCICLSYFFKFPPHLPVPLLPLIFHVQMELVSFQVLLQIVAGHSYYLLLFSPFRGRSTSSLLPDDSCLIPQRHSRDCLIVCLTAIALLRSPQ